MLYWTSRHCCVLRVNQEAKSNADMGTLGDVTKVSQLNATAQGNKATSGGKRGSFTATTHQWRS